MDKLIAITGGIGSGKSTVSSIIKQLNYKVFSADEVYRDLILDKSFVKTIYNALNIESNDFVFDKELISKKVFNNKEMLLKLNAVTHPSIMDKMLNLSKAEGGVVFNEVPLLFEGGYENIYDKVIIVTRDEKSRVEAVAKRDNISVTAAATPMLYKQRIVSAGKAPLYTAAHIPVGVAPITVQHQLNGCAGKTLIVFTLEIQSVKAANGKFLTGKSFYLLLPGSYGCVIRQKRLAVRQFFPGIFLFFLIGDIKRHPKANI